MEQIEIKSQSLKELKETVAALGEKPFRAKQLYEWIHQKLAVDFEEMTNLSKAFPGKAETAVRTDCAGDFGGADIQNRRYPEISFCPL